MAKEKVYLCPEKHSYVSNEDAKGFADLPSYCFNYERMPLLDNTLYWICPAQENFSTLNIITGVGEHISKRFWIAGLNKAKTVVSVRSMPVSSLLSTAFAYVREGIDAPKIPLSDNGLQPIYGTDYVRAMEDTSWIRQEKDYYTVTHPIILKQTGAAEVYQAGWQEGKLQVKDGNIVMIPTNMKFFERLPFIAQQEISVIEEAIEFAVGEQFHMPNLKIVRGEYEMVGNCLCVEDYFYWIGMSVEQARELYLKKFKKVNVNFNHIQDGYSIKISLQFTPQTDSHYNYKLEGILEITFSEEKINLLYKIFNIFKNFNPAEALAMDIDVIDMIQQAKYNPKIKDTVGWRTFAAEHKVNPMTSIEVKEQIDKLRQKNILEIQKLLGLMEQ